MAALQRIRDELYSLRALKESGLRKEDAYLSILNSIVPATVVDCDQQAHRDYLTDQIDALAPAEPRPLTCLVAFEDGTKFSFFRNSHRGPISSVPRNAIPVTLVLMKGEFVLFDAKLLHFGGSYLAPGNLRLHIYLLSSKCGLGTVEDEDGAQPLTEPRPLGGGKRSDYIQDLKRSATDFRATQTASKKMLKARGERLARQRLITK